MPLWSDVHTAMLAVTTVPPKGQALVAGLVALVILAVATFVLCGMRSGAFVALITGKDRRISTSNSKRRRGRTRSASLC